MLGSHAFRVTVSNVLFFRMRLTMRWRLIAVGTDETLRAIFTVGALVHKIIFRAELRVDRGRIGD